MQSGSLDTGSQLYIRDQILEYSRSQYGQLHGNAPQDSTALQNKITQVLTCLFITLYATDWPSFFDDTLALAVVNGMVSENRSTGVIFYLKILASIHDEIADILSARDGREQTRNTNLKDLIRSRDVSKLTSSWQSVLVQFSSKDSKVVEQCLAVIGRWASWTDLSLIVNDEVLSLLFEFVSSGLSSQDAASVSLRDVALNTIMEILGKKMNGENKLELIEVLKIQNVVSQLTLSGPLQDSRHTPGYDTDLAELVAKLVNQVVSDIVVILEGENSDSTVSHRAHAQLKNFLPFMLRYFSDEYDEVSSSVIPCLNDILAFFRKKSQFSRDYLSTLPSILEAIVAKMKYDETSDWGTDDAQTDEAEFQDLRKRLGILQQSVAAIDQTMLIDSVYNLIMSSFEAFQSKGGQVDWRDIELALYEMFTLGQYTTKSSTLYTKGKPASLAAERLIALMQKLSELDVAGFSHPAVHLQYVELCVRYCSFFEANSVVIPRALENFTKFIHHDHAKVKFRSWYLFLKFVKSLRLQVGNMAETIFQAIGDLLPIKAELVETADDDGSMSSNDNERPADPTFTNQLYLYEAVGNICSSPSVPVHKQVLFIRSIMEPMFVDLQSSINSAARQDEKALMQTHHLIMALGALAQGFSEWVPNNITSSAAPPAKEISEEFSKSSETILAALKTLNSPLEVRIAARNAFSRLVGVVGSRILPQLPRWIEGLLPKNQLKEDTATFLRLLNQLVYGFKTEVHDILNTLLAPLLQRVFAALAEPTTGTDDEIQLTEIKNHYVSFLLVILSNDLGQVLVSNENQATFETVITTLQHFSSDISDLPAARMAFSAMARMVMTWGGPDLPATAGGAALAEPQPLLPGFDRFAIERFSPLVWALPSNEKFNPRDAQARQVLSEAAGMAKTIYLKTGQQYLNYLQSTELLGLGWNESTMQGYLEALVTSDLKKFRQYFQVR